MKSNAPNLCPTCIRNVKCVLTHDKRQVWSCDDFKEEDHATAEKNAPEVKQKRQLQMAMA